MLCTRPALASLVRQEDCEEGVDDGYTIFRGGARGGGGGGAAAEAMRQDAAAEGRDERS